MSDTPDKPAVPDKQDWRSTVFLPKTDFPMKAGLPQKEPAILAKWQADGAYQQLREARAGAEKFILHDGPPYANGDIHIGHALNHILKDMVVRTQTLLGKDAPYVPGWDCHGLPIEWKVEEQYRKKKLDKDQVPLPEFRAECRAYAQGWVDTQREQLKRLGIGGDWDHPYLTMDFAAEATIVGELMKFAESGQLYRGAKPVMWSPVEKTALAEAEIEYEDVTSTQIDVAFEIVESPIAELVGAHAVIWTTTPWTIPVNQAIAYGPGSDYILFEQKGGPFAGKKFFVEATLEPDFYIRTGIGIFGHFLGADGEPKDASNAETGLIATYQGAQLAGTIARHPMHHLGGFFARPRPFLPGDFVTTDTGTGLVHMAPDHGEDDFSLCKANGIEPVFAVEGDGKYREDWGWLGGQGSVINTKFNAPDGPICSDLREAGALLAASDFRHSYPHSWRSKARVIYRCTPQWFIGMDQPLLDEQCETRAEKRWDNEGGALGHGPTLRQLAIRAIADTRFVPEKGRNRIGSMVEGRPDWVISRQRAWGVPIALFVERGGNAPLVDRQVNQRIVEAVAEAGVDAWCDENVPHFLGEGRDPENYERVTDILDVWFDSGCTHAFVLESGKWPGMRSPADLYLEGSDQHRGWFQSSLLESCGTRGHAPYKAVLTHGFTMDNKGMKMSKSLGNTVNPLDLMRDYGADILRLWALSVDFTEDHRIGKEILAGVADQYRKLRNTFRYLLGALEGFGADERAGQEAMPELERYMLSLLGGLDATLRQAVADYDFNSYVRALSDFCNNDLSAFYFDIRKDTLYCEVNAETGFQTDKRRAYRTVLDTIFEALVRYAAPVLVFTSEEVWGTRWPDKGSVHLLEWPEIGAAQEGAIEERWNILKTVREVAFASAEKSRTAKDIRTTLDAKINIILTDETIYNTVLSHFDAHDGLVSEIFISSEVNILRANPFEKLPVVWNSAETIGASVFASGYEKCGRCWRHLPEVLEDGDLCKRCKDVVHAS